MKYLAVFLVACAFMFSSSSAQTIPQHPKPKALYVCPMHPEVTSDKPGVCPKCKMELVKMDKKNKPAPKTPAKPVPSGQSQPGTKGVKSAETKDTSDKNAAAKTTVVYTCPMHPDVTSDKPGKCPRCKMDLVKKNND